MNAKDIPIKSTWRDAIGPKLTDRRIAKHAKAGRYGLIPKLRALAKSTDKFVRSKARAELLRYEGQPVKHSTARRVINVNEFI